MAYNQLPCVGYITPHPTVVRQQNSRDNETYRSPEKQDAQRRLHTLPPRHGMYITVPVCSDCHDVVYNLLLPRRQHECYGSGYAVYVYLVPNGSA